MSNRPRHPCQVNSRWRKHSFLKADGDWESTLTVKRYNASSILLSVDGIPRTVVSSFGGWYDFNWTYINVADGNYSLSNWGGIMEYVGGMFIIKFEIAHMYIDGGNPPLYLPQSIINQFNSTIKTIQLPDRQYFRDIDAYDDVMRPQYYLGAGIVSTVNISDPKCQKTAASLNLIGVFSNNDQWYYDARIALDQNTIDKPLSDGGGVSGGSLCSNVAKNFLNRKLNHFYSSLCLKCH